MPLPRPRELLSETQFPLHVRRSWCWEHKLPGDRERIGQWNEDSGKKKIYIYIYISTMTSTAQLCIQSATKSMPITSGKDRHGFCTLIKDSIIHTQTCAVIAAALKYAHLLFPDCFVSVSTISPSYFFNNCLGSQEKLGFLQKTRSRITSSAKTTKPSSGH